MPRLTVLTLLCVLAPALASAQAPDGDALDREQQQALREYFETHDKIRDFGSKPIEELLGDSKYTKLFSRYSDALLVIRVFSDFANYQGDEGVKKLMEEGMKKVMEKFFPNLMRTVSFFSWAKTGMELFKTFVFDPAVEGMNLDRYTKARRRGDTPGEAMTATIAFGHTRLMALTRMRAEHGDQIFQKDSKDTLLPEWEDKLRWFTNAWFETEYQKREMEEAMEALRGAAQRAQAALPSLDEEVLEILRARAARDEEQKPKPGGARDFGDAGAGTDVRSDVDTPSPACSALLAAADAAIQQEEVPAASDALARAQGACAGTASAFARLASLRTALAFIKKREDQERMAEQLCRQLDADIAQCRFPQALAILDGLGVLPYAPCIGRRAEIEGLMAKEAEVVRLLRLAQTATGKSLRQTRALLAQARAQAGPRAPACMTGGIDEAIALLDQNAAWQELLAETPEAGAKPPTPSPSPGVPAWLGSGASPPPPTEKVAGTPPSWLSPPSPSPSPAAGGEAGNPPSPPGWLGGSTAAGSGKRPEEALDDARRTLRDDHRDEQERQRRLAEERRQQEQRRREAQERIETERRIADERQRAADEEERRQRAAAEKRAEEQAAADGAVRKESVMEALNRALAQAVAAQDRARASPEARTPPPTPRPGVEPRTDTQTTLAAGGDEAKRACVECVNALITGSCYVRVATMAGWGLCLTCSADGGVDPSNRFIEKNRCPMCANVSWDLCDFKPAPKGCVPRCCSR
jgi:hypothetical protein